MISKIKQTGFRYSAAIAFNRIVPQGLFRCRRFKIFALPNFSANFSVEAGKRPEAVSFAWAETNDEFLAAEKKSGFRRTSSPGSFRACLAFREGLIVGVAWFATSQFLESELGLQIDLSPGQYWIFSTTVDQQYRRRGIYRFLLSFATNDISENDPGATFLLAINPDNRRSMLAHQSFGIKSIARVFVIRFLGVAVGWSNNIHMGRRLTWNRRTSPLRLTVNPKLVKQTR